MTAYLKSLGMTEAVLSVYRGVGAAAGVAATFTFPSLAGRIGDCSSSWYPVTSAREPFFGPSNKLLAYKTCSRSLPFCLVTLAKLFTPVDDGHARSTYDTRSAGHRVGEFSPAGDLASSARSLGCCRTVSASAGPHGNFSISSATTALLQDMPWMSQIKPLLASSAAQNASCLKALCCAYGRPVFTAVCFDVCSTLTLLKRKQQHE